MPHESRLRLTASICQRHARRVRAGLRGRYYPDDDEASIEMDPAPPRARVEDKKEEPAQRGSTTYAPAPKPAGHRGSSTDDPAPKPPGVKREPKHTSQWDGSKRITMKDLPTQMCITESINVRITSPRRCKCGCCMPRFSRSATRPWWSTWT